MRMHLFVSECIIILLYIKDLFMKTRRNISHYSQYFECIMMGAKIAHHDLAEHKISKAKSCLQFQMIFFIFSAFFYVDNFIAVSV